MPCAFKKRENEIYIIIFPMKIYWSSRILFLLGFFVMYFESLGQSNFQVLLTHFGGKGNDILNESVINNKNLFLVGSFCDSISFGTTRLGTYGYFDGFLAKADSDGNINWIKQIGGTLNDNITSVVVDKHGNSYVVGYFQKKARSGTNSMVTNFYYSEFFAKFSPSGNQLWINNLSQISPNFTNLNNRNSMKIDNSNNIYLTGSYNINSSGSQLGMFTSKINSNGILNWYKVFYGNMKQDGGAGIVIDKYNNVYSVGTTEDSLNGWGFVTIKYSQPTSISQISKDVPERYKLFQNYPNPFNSSTRIKYEIQKNSMVQLKVYDMLGKEIQTLVSEEQNAGTYETSFNGQNLSSGIYIYEIQVINKDGNSNTYREVKRMVLLK